MIKRQSILYLLMLLVLTSCQSQDPRNKNNDFSDVKKLDTHYSSKEIGWTISLPPGWERMSVAETQRIESKGQKAMEKSLDRSIDKSGLKHLLFIKKNQPNIFQASMEPFPMDSIKWKENDSFLKSVIYNTYNEQGVRADSSETTLITIDGLNFHTYKMTLYDPKGSVLIRQQIYNRLINGYSFGASITYNKEEYKKEVEKCLLSSTFKR